jgi:hypothetical protein
LNDLFQLTSIVSGAVRECVTASAKEAGRDPPGLEESNCIAKAIMAALSEAGFEIVPVQPK